MLRTYRAGKGPWGCGGWGLGSTEQLPTPGLRGQGTSPGSPAGFLGSSGWGKRPPFLSCSSSPEGPSHLPLLFSPRPPSYAPRTNVAGGGWALEGRAPAWEWAQQAPRARVGRAITLRSSLAPPGRPRPPASPDLPSLRGADPVWPPLLLPPQYPNILPVHLGVPPVSLGVRVPNRGQQAP